MNCCGKLDAAAGSAGSAIFNQLEPKPFMKLEIESGIPLPAVRGSGFTEALSAMEIGQSVLMSDVTSSSLASVRYAYVSKKLGRKFSARKVEGGIRVWRIA